MNKIILLLITLSLNLFSEAILIGSSNCSIDSLNRVELKNLYLGLTKNLKDEKITIYDRDDIKLHEEFVTKELKKSVVSLETYWVKMLFSGRAVPPKQISYTDWLKINSNECSMIYIQENEYKPTSKRIAIVE